MIPSFSCSRFIIVKKCRIGTDGQLSMHLLSRKLIGTKGRIVVKTWSAKWVRRNRLMWYHGYLLMFDDSCHHKQTSTGFLKRSRQYRLNKVTGPKAGTCHIQGSVLASAIAKKMVHSCLFRLCFNDARSFTTFSCLHNFGIYSYRGKQER